MYAYLYDPVLRQSSFRSFLDRTEARLADLGLGGKIYRLGPLLHLNEIIGEEQRRGAKTIVAVGSDRLFHQLLNAPNIQQFVVGFIPLHDRSHVGKLLGVPSDVTAATVLSHRIVRPMALGTANAVRFFWELSVGFRSPGLVIRCDEQYTVRPEHGVGLLRIRNALNDPTRFTTTIEVKRRLFADVTTSVFQNKKITLEGMNAEATIDGQPLKVEKLSIQKLPMTLRVIVGRNRHEAFADVGAALGATAGTFAMA